ncbi:hypothetical protein MXE81_12555 [Mammaliicoccus sciuri]|uniref:hypothetical protein n=1 Tax=Mammaliicoccus TaxID=2803850 RepID=UPI001AAE4C7D|nr:hypothetical protein [Mammaliicoccus sciuri]MBO3081003.1 hypothetical protein [Mammaliicoccus sciuri]MCD8778005.1 hypothetical protein [Mammaliicoccus sciuri]MCD8779682.1 hypothetical protein [Mammaliicoccus sciuri]MCD8788780.1 hypothetical protein [Mammaliicoccus sciuri]MCO4324319.1 hypothetical protein [Mammaliicoccus sciuri]
MFKHKMYYTLMIPFLIVGLLLIYVLPAEYLVLIPVIGIIFQLLYQFLFNNDKKSKNKKTTQ